MRDFNASKVLRLLGRTPKGLTIGFENFRKILKSSTMFFYKDKQSIRHAHIRSFLPKEPVVAVILAATDFEWTIRRSILSLSALPTKDIKDVFNSERKSGPSGLKDHWNKLVKPRIGIDLPSIISDWEFLSKRAYQLRNNLVHGIEGKVTLPFANKVVDCLLQASISVANFAEKQGDPVFGKKIRRIKNKIIKKLHQNEKNIN